MTDNSMPVGVGDDAAKWAAEFVKWYPCVHSHENGPAGKFKGDDLQNLMTTWFANVIETSHDFRMAMIEDVKKEEVVDDDHPSTYDPLKD